MALELQLSWGTLRRRARAIASSLQGLGSPVGERALLLFPRGLEFAAGFFGTLGSGAIAVTAPSPDPARIEKTAPRLRGIVRDSGARYGLTARRMWQFRLELFRRAPELARLQWILTDEIDRLARAWGTPRVCSDSLALLQYTSGSTGWPKGCASTTAKVKRQECRHRYLEGPRHEVPWTGALRQADDQGTAVPV